MCLIVLAWRAHPQFPLIVAANRDEFHDRPSAALARWEDPPGMIAGRDLRSGGTWLGVDAQGRFGTVTNYRDLQRPRPDAPTRGMLVPEFLGQARAPQDYLAGIAANAAQYSGFNLLLADQNSLWYASNRSESFARPLAPGVHGLSNHLLDTPWPKLLRVRERFERWLGAPESASVRGLFEILTDQEPAPRDPNASPSHLPPELERALSAPFVSHPQYGTRCSTVVLRKESGAVDVCERTFNAGGVQTGEISRHS